VGIDDVELAIDQYRQWRAGEVPRNYK
jgi:hypothetical protein